MAEIVSWGRAGCAEAAYVECSPLRRYFQLLSSSECFQPHHSIAFYALGMWVGRCYPAFSFCPFVAHLGAYWCYCPFFPTLKDVDPSLPWLPVLGVWSWYSV